MVKLYHYTSAEGCSGILSEGVIRSSKDRARDVYMGEGVYLTSLPPSTDNWKLLKNNWDGSESTLLDKLNRLDFYIEFDSTDLPSARKDKGKRDIWLVPHDIDLREVPHKTRVRGGNVQVAHSYGYL
ncbi:hypothetical protein ANN_16565 [Periplaneta americana]|uniref:Tox-ART-HYD1 domain-containing protein n=1 Tax=Periplaneta americana TaxID=6978 RepID=A0ABQ8SRV2_PERAM|nr:hypothetical protein ANN_16565 [Periplaneta americana]